MKAIVALLLAVCVTVADMRFGSQPWNSYKVRDYNNAVKFVEQSRGNAVYESPGTFGYAKLAQQKQNNYDNQLRSNIDNQQDNRNFNDEEGRDHLPMRLNSDIVADGVFSDTVPRTQQEIKNMPINITVQPSQDVLIPMRWNNPHAAEIEANIWVHNAEELVVVPIKKPTCHGEGHQDGIFHFKVPADFNSAIAAKVPGFKGCFDIGDCDLQVYAHSVESRMYSVGTSIIIQGYAGQGFVARDIKEPDTDPELDLDALDIDICRLATDASADIPNAVPYKPRLISDQANHAYQNSDYSPYSGQQPRAISKNLQASAVIKMVSGNRGELGKNILPAATKTAQQNLQKTQNQVYQRYENYANKIIRTVGNSMKSTATIGGAGGQELANCFGCATAAATNARRLTTTTYIPSFDLTDELVTQSKSLVPEDYQNLFKTNSVTGKTSVNIYVAAMEKLMPLFKEAAEQYGLKYMPPVLKDSPATKADETKFRKRNANGATDKGVYASTLNLKASVASSSCPEECLECEGGTAPPMLKSSSGTCVTRCSAGVCAEGNVGTVCTGCANLFVLAAKTVGQLDTSLEGGLTGEVQLPSDGLDEGDRVLPMKEDFKDKPCENDFDISDCELLDSGSLKILPYGAILFAALSLLLMR